MTKKNEIISFEERSKKSLMQKFYQKSFYVGTIMIEFAEAPSVEEAQCYIDLKIIHKEKAFYYLKSIAETLLEERGEEEVVLTPEMILNTITSIEIYESFGNDVEYEFFYKYDLEKGKEQFFQIIIATVCRI